MNKWIALVAILCATKSFGQVASEILLFDLQVKKDKVILANPVNISHHKGYDNQPSFHSSLPIVYYSSFNDDGRSDIKFYNYKTGTTSSLTKTQEREYSPTLTPDKQFVSCIIQRDDGAQDLGKYPVEGGAPAILVDKLIVGYHVWADNSHLALFVLGKDNAPNTLHYLRLPTKADTIIASNIGRSLHRVPKENAISFVHKIAEKEWIIKKFNTLNDEVTIIAPALSGREDLCWTADGKIIMSDGAKIFWIDPKKGKEWKEVQITSGADLLKGVTRLAIDAEGKKLAVVVVE